MNISTKVMSDIIDYLEELNILTDFQDSQLTRRINILKRMNTSEKEGLKNE